MQRMMFSLVLSLVGFVSTAWTYSGGTGEPNNPYQIATAEDLIALGNEPNDYNDCFILTTDIDLSGYTFDRAVIAPDQGGAGFQGKMFTGSVEGHGHIIHSLHIEGEGYLGLFGYCSKEATLSKLCLEDVDVCGLGNNVGGLVGYNEGTLISSYSDGNVRGDCATGILVGLNKGIVISSYSAGIVSGVRYIGGLVGFNSDGAVIASHSIAEVNGDENIGGLVGINSRSQGLILSSYSAGQVHAIGDVGGLVGRNEYGTVTSSYSLGRVCGTDYVGGLVGNNYLGTITSSFSTGVIDGNEYVGGLVGFNHIATVISSFWDVESSGHLDSDGGIGLTTVEMQAAQTFTEACWDLVGESSHGTCNYWSVKEGTYPSLTAFMDANLSEFDGMGTLADPYVLTDANDLGMVWCHPNACYRLGADIDLEGIDWVDSVIPRFNGYFDGNGCVIRNLKIDGLSYLGLFGCCLSEASVSNLNLESVDVNSISGGNIGGLIGRNYGIVDFITLHGIVSGSGSLGGLVGRNYGLITSVCVNGAFSGDSSTGGIVGSNEQGTISLSHNTGTVDGQRYTGGLVGYNNGGVISESCNTGSISGSELLGGVVGANLEGVIMASYNTGVVTGIEDVYSNNFVGGLVGLNDKGEVTWSYNLGTVSGGHWVGGLVGSNDQGEVASSYSDGVVNGDGSIGGLAGLNDEGMIASCYSIGSVSGDSVGGLVGQNEGTINLSYSTVTTFSTGIAGGLVGYNYGIVMSSYSVGSVSGMMLAGGLVGGVSGGRRSTGTVLLSFWDIENSGLTDSNGGTGLTTAEMQDIETFLDTGWDFVDETANGTDDIWTMPDANYPHLTWEFEE